MQQIHEDRILIEHASGVRKALVGVAKLSQTDDTGTVPRQVGAGALSIRIPLRTHLALLVTNLPCDGWPQRDFAGTER